MAKKCGSKALLGQGSVEFIFSLVLFMVSMLAIADLVRIGYAWAGLQYAVNEGARWASVQNSASSITDLKNKIMQTGQVWNMGINPNDINIVYPANTRTPLSFFTISATKAVTLNPLSGMLLTAAGNNSGTYRVAAQTMIRNENF